MTARPIKTSSGPFNAGPIESQDGQPVKMFRIAVFAAVACACIRINAGGRDDDADNVCSLPTIGKQALVMPILFTTDGPRNTVVYPDDEGCLRLKKGQSFKLSCTTVKFVSKDFEEVSDVQVTCEGGDRLGYKGQTYRYENFKCNAMPKSQLRVTGETCQPKGYTVAEVGFRTQDAFIGLYRVCFDKSTKNSLYTWYVARSPYYDNRQKTGGRPRFVRSRELYGNTDVDKKYSIVEQRKTVSEILKSNKLGEKYLLDDGKHSLSRGHYAANADFFFGYEQFATFYYANAAPQWQIFNGHKWADVENNTRKTLAGAMNNDDGWLIVTGTYRLCMLPDKDKQQRPLFLDPPSSIPVPLFYWKMVLNRFTKDGIVYIGLNNPHKVIDDSLYLCPNTCPGAYDYGQAGVDANPGLIYCCTKESFENFYGKLDPIVYRQF